MSTPPSDSTSQSHSEGSNFSGNSESHNTAASAESQMGSGNRRPGYHEIFGTDSDAESTEVTSSYRNTFASYEHADPHDATTTTPQPIIDNPGYWSARESEPIDAEFSDITSARDVVPENDELGEDTAFASSPYEIAYGHHDHQDSTASTSDYEPHDSDYHEADYPLEDEHEPSAYDDHQHSPGAPDPADEVTEFPAITPEMIAARAAHHTEPVDDDDDSLDHSFEAHPADHDYTTEESQADEYSTQSSSEEDWDHDEEAAAVHHTNSETEGSETAEAKDEPQTEKTWQEKLERFKTTPILASGIVIIALLLSALAGAVWMSANDDFQVSKHKDSPADSKAASAPTSDSSAASGRNFPTPGGKTIKGNIGQTLSISGDKVKICGDATGSLTRSAVPTSVDCQVGDETLKVYNNAAADKRDTLTITSPVSGNDFTLKCSELQTDLVRCTDDDSGLEVFLGH